MVSYVTLCYLISYYISPPIIHNMANHNTTPSPLCWLLTISMISMPSTSGARIGQTLNPKLETAIDQWCKDRPNPLIRSVFIISNRKTSN